ncbi:Molecular chaperone Hsp40/DnaJ family protein [Trifolium repens]|nr:Molecular chaperone Hsp40/DnaJ family protein [Trifolium repens]
MQSHLLVGPISIAAHATAADSNYLSAAPRLAAGDIYSSQQPHPQQSTAVATTTPYSASPVLLTLLKSNVLIVSSLASIILMLARIHMPLNCSKVSVMRMKYYRMKQQDFSMIENFNPVTSHTKKNGVTTLNLKTR